MTQLNNNFKYFSVSICPDVTCTNHYKSKCIVNDLSIAAFSEVVPKIPLASCEVKEQLAQYKLNSIIEGS